MARLTKEQAEARRARVLELRPIVAALVPLHQQPRAGGTRTDNIAIANALNARGMLNLAGKEWSKQDVSNFTARDLEDKGAVQSDSEEPREREVEEPSAPCNRPAIDMSESDTAPAYSSSAEIATMDVASYIPETCDRPVIDHERAALPDDLVKILTSAYASGALTGMLEWWHRTHGEQPMAKRPRFVGKRANSGLLINESLKNRAFAKAKQENMSLSQLTELLYWRYIGEPAEFVADDE